MTSAFDQSLLASLNEKARGFREEILLRCAGLVETVEFTKFDNYREAFSAPNPQNEQLRSLLNTEVKFIHRSTHDYLHEEGRKLLEQYQLSDQDARSILGFAHIGYLCLDNVVAVNITNYTSLYPTEISFEAIHYAQLPDVEAHYAIYDAFLARLEHHLLSPKSFHDHKAAFHFVGLAFWNSDVPSTINLNIALSTEFSARIFESHTIPLLQCLHSRERETAPSYTL